MHGDPEGADSGVQGGIQQAPGDTKKDRVVTVLLRDDHDVAGFDCRRSSKVNRFLKKQAADWQRARLCRVFIVENPQSPKQIWAYYTLCSSVIVTAQMDVKYTKGFPPKIPMAHLGYMGRHNDPAIKGAGPGLLLDMALRVVRAREDLDVWGIWLNAESEGLVKWYTKMGFERVVPDPRKTAAGEPPPKAMYVQPETLLKVLT